MTLGRGYWISMWLFSLVAYWAVASWAVQQQNPRLLWLWLVLTYSQYLAWHYRDKGWPARLAPAAPGVILIVTRLLGRW